MTIRHHPGDEFLLAHASGAAGEAVSLLVGTHLALCPACRAKVASMEQIGGALLDDMAPVDMAASALSQTMAKLDDVAQDRHVHATGLLPPVIAPEPLRSYIHGDIDRVRWIPMAPGVSYRPLLRRKDVRVQLIRTAPGAGVGTHTHRGEELTLVLAGGFTDVTGSYRRGDLQTTTPEIVHRPVTDDDGTCITLAMTDAPLRFMSPLVGALGKLFGF
jgi:putative transcriptional regulator